MWARKSHIGSRVVVAILAVIPLVVASTAIAQQERVLHSFGSGVDGYWPAGTMISDAAGNLYGTTNGGGEYGFGTVFELMPAAGSWTERILYSFRDDGSDGLNPWSGLIMDASGNLYGTTAAGGPYNCGTYPCGTVFELSPTAGGWTESVLYSFSGTDGAEPFAGLVFDAVGNLYGVTYRGGRNNYGTVFELSPQANGVWTEQVLLDFDGLDGFSPWAGLVFDAAGNLDGATLSGGRYNSGTVFQLTPHAGSNWTEQVLLSFGGTYAGGPFGTLTPNAAGNLYGVSSGGGAGPGLVFELTPGAGGWTEKIIRLLGGTVGGYSEAPLTFDDSGNLYGTTESGGPYGMGTLFELEPTADHGWAESILHAFNPEAGDGSYPVSGLVLDPAGNIFGITYSGGAYNGGTVFEIRR